MHWIKLTFYADRWTFTVLFLNFNRATIKKETSLLVSLHEFSYGMRLSPQIKSDFWRPIRIKYKVNFTDDFTSWTDSLDAQALKQRYETSTATRGFKKRNLTMHINTSHKTAILVEPGHILQRKCPLVFPLMSYKCSVSAAFYLAKLSSSTTPCCSFGLLEAYMLDSGTSVNHRVEAEQS